VIRFERMAHAKQRSKAGSGEKFDKRHIERSFRIVRESAAAAAASTYGFSRI
jgi:hypothetical protein